VNTPMTELAPPGDKFMAEDLPRIHAALERARTVKAASRVTIDVAENGGIISILLETKKKFK